MPPYYARSQFISAHRQTTSSLEFWQWFDDQCTPQERAYINTARDGHETILRCKEVIQRQGGWAHVQGRK